MLSNLLCWGKWGQFSENLTVCSVHWNSKSYLAQIQDFERCL